MMTEKELTEITQRSTKTRKHEKKKRKNKHQSPVTPRKAPKSATWRLHERKEDPFRGELEVLHKADAGGTPSTEDFGADACKHDKALIFHLPKGRTGREVVSWRQNHEVA